jgi:hypothetical protein
MAHQGGTDNRSDDDRKNEYRKAVEAVKTRLEDRASTRPLHPTHQRMLKSVAKANSLGTKGRGRNPRTRKVLQKRIAVQGPNNYAAFVCRLRSTTSRIAVTTRSGSSNWIQ